MAGVAEVNGKRPLAVALLQFTPPSRLRLFARTARRAEKTLIIPLVAMKAAMDQQLHAVARQLPNQESLIEWTCATCLP